VVVAGHSGGAAIAANILGRRPALIDAALVVSCPCDVELRSSPLACLLAHPSTFTLVSSLGLVLFVVDWWIMTLALRENACAAPVVKHQADRQHTVIESGVYSVVRHPMYEGAVPPVSACRCGWNRTPRLCWPAFPSGHWWCGSWSRNSS
jgi:protein-S-isoprenylcysteine O-methyltransferase Ste14